jgi:glycosyltransferase involved in cell wall biosynthesis
MPAGARRDLVPPRLRVARVKFLFVHQNFPGQYLHVIRHLIARPGNEVAFITEPNKNNIPGVRRINYQVTQPAAEHIHPSLRDLNLAVTRGDAVARFPGVPILGYFEFYYATAGTDVGFDPEFVTGVEQYPRIRAMNAVNLLALSLNQHGQTPTEWQRSLYPEWAQKQIHLLPEGVALDVCKPDPGARKKPLVVKDFTIAPGDKLITYVARNLEPYRGFHVMMRALPEVLRARPDAKVVMLGGDEVSYGARIANTTWRAHMQRELAGKYDASRVLMPGQVPYDVHVSLLQRSDVHVYLTYPFVLSWSLREAMACGCAIVGSDVAPVREFLTDGETGLLTPCLDPAKLAGRILEVLENRKLAGGLRANARAWAERHLSMDDYLAGYDRLFTELTGRPSIPSPPVSPASRRRRATAKAAP